MAVLRALKIAAVLAAAATASAAAAQQPVQLQFQDGRVTLRAQNAPIRTILAEWARLGGATIVNGDRIAGPPVTLELVGVPERQALDIVLRNVAGYLLAPRRAGATGASTFDRIVVLPTSAAPRNPPPPAAAARPAPVLPRPPLVARPPEATPGEPPGEVPQGEDAAADPVMPPEQPVIPGPRGIPRPLVRPPVAPPGAGPELVPEQPDPKDEAPATTPTQPGMPAQPGMTSTPGNPFGVPAGSSARPGVIAPAPRPQSQQPAPNGVQ